MANTVTALAEGAKLTANTNQDTLRFGLGAASEIAQRSTDHVIELFSFSGKRTQDVTTHAAERLQAVGQSSTALVRGWQEVSREWLAMTQNRLHERGGDHGTFALPLAARSWLPYCPLPWQCRPDT